MLKWILFVLDVIGRFLRLKSEQKSEDAAAAERAKQEAAAKAKQVGDNIADGAASIPRPSIDPDDDPFSAYNRIR